MFEDQAYKIIANNSVRMNNGDTTVDASTAYMAVDFARNDEREKIAQVLNKWNDVNEILPHSFERVLVKNTEQDKYDVGFLANDKWRSRVGKVTHWKRFEK